jgi:microcin C transport system permease protein
MGAYLIRRLLLVIPTLWAIITINFFIVQIAPAARSIRPLPPLNLATAAACPAAAVKGWAPAMREPA